MADDPNQIVSRTSRPSAARPTRRDSPTPSRPSQAGPRPLRSRRILYIFSGPARPFDGLAAIAALVGVSVDEVDSTWYQNLRVLSAQPADFHVGTSTAPRGGSSSGSSCLLEQDLWPGYEQCAHILSRKCECCSCSIHVLLCWHMV